MKKSTQIILLLAIVLLTLEVFAQSEHKSSNMENSSIAPILPNGKNFSFGEAYKAKENSFSLNWGIKLRLGIKKNILHSILQKEK